MAIQICPVCKQEGFSWHMDEEQTPLTIWGCFCGYSALEDESDVRICSTCKEKTETRLQHQDGSFRWWCYKCLNEQYKANRHAQ